MKLKFGIPCSKIKKEIKDVELNCSSESQALGVACGCILSGKEPTIYTQNSGLCNMIDGLTSLFQPYGIPYPKMILSVRRRPLHHQFIGEITDDLLMLLEYPKEKLEIVRQK